MIEFLKYLWRQPRQLREYSKLFRFRDGLVLMLRGKPGGVISIFSKELQQHITLRPGTSDLKVILKVLAEHEYAVRFPADPKLIIDAGANIGISALYFAWRFPDAKIYAIEPEDGNFELLKQNCKDRRNIRLQKAALWNYPARVVLQDKDAANWCFSVKPAEGDEGKIDTVTIPQILDDSGLQRIDILKIDIEGSEKALFSNDYDAWLSRVRLLIIELHDHYVPGCAKAFYSALYSRPFTQELSGENVVIHFDPVKNSLE
jgi:FkbM family methyltransferase